MKYTPYMFSKTLFFSKRYVYVHTGQHISIWASKHINHTHFNYTETTNKEPLVLGCESSGEVSTWFPPLIVPSLWGKLSLPNFPGSAQYPHFHQRKGGWDLIWLTNIKEKTSRTNPAPSWLFTRWMHILLYSSMPTVIGAIFVTSEHSPAESALRTE